MMTCGLFVQLEAARNQEAAVERFLAEAIPMVRTEPDTAAWFAVRFRRHHYGIFDVFPDDDARKRHLGGPVARTLAEHISLFAGPPIFHEVEILADKLPLIGKVDPDRKGLFLRVKPLRGRETELAELFTSTEAIVDREPGTTTWFAMRFANGDLGFFDAFETSHGRRKHLFGMAPRQLLKNFRLLGGFPHVSLLDVKAEAFTGESRA